MTGAVRSPTQNMLQSTGSMLDMKGRKSLIVSAALADVLWEVSLRVMSAALYLGRDWSASTRRTKGWVRRDTDGIDRTGCESEEYAPMSRRGWFGFTFLYDDLMLAIRHPFPHALQSWDARSQALKLFSCHNMLTDLSTRNRLAETNNIEG